MKKAYVVLEFDNIDEEHEEIGVPYIVGVFSKKSIAFRVAKRLFEKYGDYCTYAVQDYELNRVYLDEQSDEEMMAETSKAIEEMVKNGILDYKVGEDGDFYFELTEKGKKSIE